MQRADYKGIIYEIQVEETEVEENEEEKQTVYFELEYGQNPDFVDICAFCLQYFFNKDLEAINCAKCSKILTPWVERIISLSS